MTRTAPGGATGAGRGRGMADRPARRSALDLQDPSRWDTREVAEGVRVLQSALALGRTGRYQLEAAIAALHDDAQRADETDRP